MRLHLTTPTAGARADGRWERLQDLLFDLKPGQKVTIGSVAARTGLGVESVDTVLQALTRAELFVQLDPTTFLRERLRKLSIA
jgi:hypothetical protein